MIASGRGYFTKRAAADYASVSIRTLERAIAAGELRAVRTPSGRVRIRPEWIDKWLGAEPDEDERAAV